MKKNVFSTLSARAALALAASLLISLSSCEKEKSGSKPDLVGGGSVTMTTEIAVGEEITLWFAIGDEPSVEGADETESKEEDGWKKNKYTLKAQNLVIKGKVTKLDCNGNKLTSLDVSKNAELTMLICCWNSLTSLDVSKNTKLEILYCHYNSLTSLDVSGNTKLKELGCYNNSLASLDVSGSTKLTNLDCSNNSLASLDVSNNTKLKELFCHNNSLNGESLELPDLANEGILYFKYGAEDAQMLTEDEVKDIRDNKHWAVKTHDSGDWHDYEGEERAIAMTTEGAVGVEFYLKFAPDDKPTVEGAEETESEEEDGWLKKKYQLKAQNLVIKGKITKFDCGNNDLTSLDVRKNTKLTALICNNNSLSSLDVSKNTELTVLSCNNNMLSSLDVSRNTELTELYCYNNKLTSLDVRKNTKLTLLKCSYNNKLSSLDVSGNTELTRLDCSNNSLTSLDASGSTKLTKLYCYKNKLTFKEMKLPKLSAEGKLYFKDTDEGDSQKLTAAQVKEIKEKNWTVWQHKGKNWVDYPGK